ncbi:response regulator transcription factor [Nocardioides jishulii]|uniref:Response regulator transcription factor n=1 Tax=Nocardioides jishulii TaxID=2575440 RepID=A0A4U2YLW4_9ACTN|nr:response regulator transcription factor [Nocardioides jishulii]QCX27327.1 response regulator transcription factor [Nocardioides jishulii]TKI61814.1 response regulator transcription factor [Nocardioides jishulii]
MKRRTVLLVEDERTISDALADRFRSEGYEVAQAFDGPSAVQTAEAFQPDVVVLDVMLPGFDGHEVCRRIQATRPVPVLMLTARDEEADVLVGLGVGADDYLTKPFRIREVVARVAALLRRVERASALSSQDAPADAEVLRVGDLEVDLAERRVRVAGGEVHLTRTEFDLLAVLAGEPGRVQSRERLLAEVWDWADAAGTRTVDSHVKAVRQKIGPERIRTVHGVGYALEAVR